MNMAFTLASSDTTLNNGLILFDTFIEMRIEVDGIIRTMRERLDCVYPLLWITMFNLTLEGQFNFVLAQRDKNQWQVLDLFSSPL